MIEVKVVHPHAHLLAETGRGMARTYTDVLTGDWAAIADLCADKIRNPHEAHVALAAAASGSGHVFTTDVPEMRESVVGDDYVLNIDHERGEGHAIAALDLFMRVLCGQWDQADWLARLSATHIGNGAPFYLNTLRAVLCRSPEEPLGARTRPLKENEFPGHPNASVSIAGATLPARVAYHAYKLMGAGAPGGPTFSLPGGELQVFVDGERVNKTRQY